MSDIQASRQRLQELRRAAEPPEPLVKAFRKMQVAEGEWLRSQRTPEESSALSHYDLARDEYNRQFIASKPWLGQSYDFEVQTEITVLELEIARADGAPYLVDLNLAWPTTSDPPQLIASPDLSGSDEMFFQLAMRPPAVWFGARGTSPNTPPINGSLLAVFEAPNPLPLWGPTQLKYGYPNEEALKDGDFGLRNQHFGAGFHGIGCYEQMNSSWQREIVATNQFNYPHTPTELGLHHFVFTFKENTLEVLAAKVTLIFISQTEQLNDVVNRYLEFTEFKN
jgi:hypothetical protein